MQDLARLAAPYLRLSHPIPCTAGETMGPGLGRAGRGGEGRNPLAAACWPAGPSRNHTTSPPVHPFDLERRGEGGSRAKLLLAGRSAAGAPGRKPVKADPTIPVPIESQATATWHSLTVYFILMIFKNKIKKLDKCCFFSVNETIHEICVPWRAHAKASVDSERSEMVRTVGVAGDDA